MTTSSPALKHALLSASGSSRWLNCPGSINAEKPYKGDKSSIFAEEGVLAHELADTCLKLQNDAEVYVNTKMLGKDIDTDMARHVQEYLDFVRSHETPTSQLYTEERVDFSNIAPGGFGTMDSAVLDHKAGVCHIFDLKYGKGISISAFENSQAQLYALGLYNEIAFLNDIKSFRIHIVQPRLYNFSQWDITVEDLLQFGKWVSERANLCLTVDAPRVPGESQCRWCKAKGDCPALAKFTEQIILAEFSELPHTELAPERLSNRQKKSILDNKKLIETFLEAVKAGVFDYIDSGHSFKGYKLVEGRSVRKWTDTAENALSQQLGEAAYKKSLIGVVEAQKRLGKEAVDALVFKPAGKPTLVPDSDKRTAIMKGKTEDLFDKIE